MKPQYIIKKFSGMWEDWLFWCEWFSPEKSWWDINLINNLRTWDVAKVTDVWFTTYENSKAMDDITIWTTAGVVTIGQRYLHAFEVYWQYKFQLHDLWADSLNSWRYPDLATTKERDLLYTSPISVWRWYRAKATSASATTLVDNTKDFWYSIYSTYDGYLLPSLDTYNNKVTNLTKQKEYTITSIWFSNLEGADLSGSYANTYTCPATISEAAANLRTWTPTKNISSQVGIWIVSKGSGVVTVTVHDSLNTVLSTYSIATASLTDWAMNYFYCPAFKDYWPNLHFHVTSTGTTTIKTNTASNMSDCSFNIRIGDTLNFASATPTPQTNDEFMLFVDRKYSFNDTNNSVTYPHFYGQIDRTDFKRQIVTYGDEFFFLNGNWMSSLSDETFSAGAKKMPYNHQLVAIWVNGSKVLFSCEYKGRGKLMLWDGYSAWYEQILDVDLPVHALETYADGWVYLCNWSLYYTNGYSTKWLSWIPDSNSLNRNLLDVSSFNALKFYNNKLVIAWYWEITQRATSGIYIYDMEWNWSYQPIYSSSKNRYWYTIYTVFFFSDYIWFARSSPVLLTWSDLWIHNLSGTWYDGNFIMKLKLWEKRRMSMVRLNLTRTDSIALNSNSANWYYDITCSYGKGKSGVLTSIQTTSSTTTTITVPWQYEKAETWTEVLVLTWSWANDPIGERTFIQSKTGEWTATEIWTISPALSASAGSTLYLKNINVKKSWTNRILVHDLNETCDFDLNDFYGDTLVLEFVFKWTTANNVWVSSIEIY